MVKLAVLLAAATLVGAQPGVAQPRAEEACPIMCRAMMPIGSCPSVERVPEGAIGIVGKVVRSVPVQCATRLSVEVTRASQGNIGGTIQVDVGPCLVWSG